jgi:hypothetical protein
MTTVVSIQDYCDDPTKYVKILPDNTIKYWDQYCSVRKAAGILKDSSIEELGKAVPQALLGMLEGMLTPESMGMIAGVIGLNIASKSIFKSIVNKIAANFSEEMVEAMSEIIVEEGASIAAVNASALLTSVLDNAMTETIGDVGYYSLGVLFKGMEGLADIIPILGQIMMLFQVLGMIFDSWDPCNLNDELNSETIYLFNNNFNIVFRENMLVAVNSFTDPYGNVYFVDSWPIDFYADRGILITQKEDYYSPLRMKYMTRWLNSRDFNSNNQPIYWPKGGVQADNNTLDKINKINKNLSITISDGNTIVANWIYKVFPIIILVIIIIIILIFYLIK